MPRLRLLELTLVKLLDLKVAVSHVHSTFKGCSTHKFTGPWGLANPFLIVQVWNVYQGPHHKPSTLSNLNKFRDRIPDIVCFMVWPDSWVLTILLIWLAPFNPPKDITSTFDVVAFIYAATHMALHCGNSSVTDILSNLWITEIISEDLNACALCKAGK